MNHRWRGMLTVSCGLMLSAGITVAGCGSDPDGFDDGNGNGDDNGNGNGIQNGNGDGGGGQGDGGSSGRPACATAEAGAVRQPVYLHVVLDVTRSMDGHGTDATRAECDSTYTNYQDDTCFIRDAREPDPRFANRTLGVCHRIADDVDQCPNWRGLTGKKWLAAREALVAFFDSAQANADPRMGVGMYRFDERTTPTSPWHVGPAFVDQTQATALKATVLDEFALRGGTRLGGALRSQSAALRDFEPSAPLEAGGRRVLVVITDGAPDGANIDTDRGGCGAGGNRYQGCIDFVEALHQDEGIVTFVIGVGDVDAQESSVYNERFLSRLAQAGGAGPEGCDPDWDGETQPLSEACHFQVTPGERSAEELQQDMTQAFFNIARQVQSCELALNKTSPIDPNAVNVVFTDADGNQRQIPQGAEDGWTYDNPEDPSAVILNGDACSDLREDASASVSIVIGCPTGTSVVN